MTGPRVVAIVQARMGSSRLPGKVLMPFAGRSVLGSVIGRLQAIRALDAIVIATTTHARDAAIATEAARWGAAVARGSEDDVLDRYRHAARENRADIVVRVTSDCPLIDPGVSGRIIETFLERRSGDRRLDYLSNTIARSFPRGFDTEVFEADALERAWREGTSPAEREHVTPYLYRHPELFRQAQYVGARDHSRYRLTVDTDEDYRALLAVVAGMKLDRRVADAEEVIVFLAAHPEIVAINAHVEQKALER